MVKGNRSYQVSEKISVPYTDRQLKITAETFRDKLTPGMEEEWKAVSQAWDDEPKASNTKTLSKIAELLVKEKYFDSMLADIERKQGH